MTSGIRTLVYPVTDLARAKARFTALAGAAPHTDSPYYVGFQVAGQEVGLVPGGVAEGVAGVIPYWHVDDLDARLEALVADGGEVVQPARHVGGTRRVAALRDPDGNLIGLLQDG